MKGIFKVVFINEGTEITKRDGSQCRKYTVTLRELGGKYEDQYATTLFSDGPCPLSEGQNIAGSLRFTVRNYEGQDYQDIVLQEYITVMERLVLPRISSYGLGSPTGNE